MRYYETTITADDGTVLAKNVSRAGMYVCYDDVTLETWRRRGATAHVREIEVPVPGPRKGLMRFSR